MKDFALRLIHLQSPLDVYLLTELFHKTKNENILNETHNLTQI
jgi:hypothetical protein